MIFLVKLCRAEIFWATALWKWTFCTLFQSELVRPLNTKNVSYNLVELLTKIWNFWGTGFSVMNFCSELPVFPYCMLNSYFWVMTCVCNYFTDGCPWVCCGEYWWHICHHWLAVGGLHTHCVESLVCCRPHHPSFLRGGGVRGVGRT
jgi:hypothetical protein